MSRPYAYDELPYPSKFFIQTRPNRMGAAGVLYGMHPAPADACRVLELGCGNGSNLIGQAYGLPTSEFVGVDLSAVQIADANGAAAELGLKNIEFRQMDVMEMTTDDFGEFDYVIAHGLISWVPEVVWRRVMSLVGKLLTANGIGYVSYNVYPGSYIREMVRSISRFHTRNTERPAQKVSESLSLLKMIARNLPAGSVAKKIFEQENARQQQRLVGDFYHDELGDAYQPFLFHDVALMAAENGLQFLSEAEINASSWQGLDREAVYSLNSLESRVDREQYLDFYRGRIFRQTLFCRSEIPLNEHPEPEVLDKLSLASTLRPKSGKPDLAAGKVETFVSPRDQNIDIDHPLTKAALVKLAEAWGRSVKTPELLVKARKALTAAGVKITDWERQTETARNVLLQIALGSDAIFLNTYQFAAKTEPSEKPRVNRLARWQLGKGKGVLTLLGLDLKLEGKASQHLLYLLDGTRSRSDVATEMKHFIEATDDMTAEEKRDLLADLAGWIGRSIGELARLGVFEA